MTNPMYITKLENLCRDAMHRENESLMHRYMAMQELHHARVLIEQELEHGSSMSKKELLGILDSLVGTADGLMARSEGLLHFLDPDHY